MAVRQKTRLREVLNNATLNTDEKIVLLERVIDEAVKKERERAVHLHDKLTDARGRLRADALATKEPGRRATMGGMREGVTLAITYMDHVYRDVDLAQEAEGA